MGYPKYTTVHYATVNTVLYCTVQYMRVYSYLRVSVCKVVREAMASVVSCENIQHSIIILLQNIYASFKPEKDTGVIKIN